MVERANLVSALAMQADGPGSGPVTVDGRPRQVHQASAASTIELFLGRPTLLLCCSAQHRYTTNAQNNNATPSYAIEMRHGRTSVPETPAEALGARRCAPSSCRYCCVSSVWTRNAAAEMQQQPNRADVTCTTTRMASRVVDSSWRLEAPRQAGEGSDLLQRTSMRAGTTP